MESSAKNAMLYDVHKKSTLVAYLLWWFFGMFGGHRFYLGRTGSAVAMLIVTLISIPAAFIAIGFVGLAAVGIWVIVDAFLIPGIIRQNNLSLIAKLG